MMGCLVENRFGKITIFFSLNPYILIKKYRLLKAIILFKFWLKRNAPFGDGQKRNYRDAFSKIGFLCFIRLHGPLFSSVLIERDFSTLHNRLGTEKAGKLVFII